MLNERSTRAYELAARAYRERLRAEKAKDAELLEGTLHGEVVEVLGEYDHAGTVLRATGVPFVSVRPGELHRVDWERAQVAWINCPGNLTDGDLERVVGWVRGGGYLSTTDWALRNVLERAFPGKVRHNGGSIPDSVVAVERVATSPLLSGFFEDGREPRWWMEGASFPCEVLDPSVRVLIRSSEVGERYGADAVVVEWDEGEGKVFHLVSHLYLQRAETRTERDRAGAKEFFAESGWKEDEAVRLAAEAGDLQASELKAALTTASLASEMLLQKKRKS